MKKKLLVCYLDLMKSVQDKQEWVKAREYGEIALKKLSSLLYSSFELYLLYIRLGFAYSRLAKYSQSLDMYYNAHLIASKQHLPPERIAYASYMLGRNFLAIKRINQALSQFQKVENYYQKYGDSLLPMDNKMRFSTLSCLGVCYLYKEDIEKAKEIIQVKLPQFRNIISDFGEYYRLKGEYLAMQKEYAEAREVFQEYIKMAETLKFYDSVFAVKIRLAGIDLLEGKLDSAITSLETLFKNKSNWRFNDLICKVGILLSKCYNLKNMSDKASVVERRIKPLLNKIDIVWFYEKTREFEHLFQQIQKLYKNTQPIIESVPISFLYTLNQYYDKLPYKIIGRSYPIQEIYQVIEKTASTNLPILIQGETGTGKELIARAIHQRSLRNEKTWLATNCGAISETLLENELFGHSKGAFTDAHGDKKGYIELTSEGTLFLDEISEMSPSMQQKLLRVMDEKLVWRLGAEKPVPVNTRFIFASNQNIEELVRVKKFREDLYYRINTIVITLPPLRDRKDDIPLLVKHFLDKYSVSAKSEIRSSKSEITPSALALLQGYSWPGNIRELENEIKKICTLYSFAVQINESMISDSIKNCQPRVVSKYRLEIRESKDLQEKSLIIETLTKCKGNISRCAKEIGWSRRHLYRKIHTLKIPVGNYVTQK